MMETFNFVDWYLGLEFPAQIAIGAAGIAIAVLVLIATFYILKYVFLGLFYLFKGIAMGFIKATKWVARKIAGQPQCCAAPGAKAEQDPFKQGVPAPAPAPARVPVPTPAPAQVDVTPRFCAHCGLPLAPNAQARLTAGQAAYCAECGTRLLPEEVVASPAAVGPSA